MTTMQPRVGRTTATRSAVLPADPLGSAARLRQARLDPDVLAARALHVLVDGGTLALLVAVPVLAVLVAAVLATVPPVVPVVAVALSVAVVLAAALVVWPHHDGGRTAGMRYTGLRVADRDGGVPSRGALAVRALLIPVDVVVGPVLVLARSDRRRLADLLVGTQVVRDLSAAAGPAGRPDTARSPRARPLPAAPARRR